MLAWLKSLFNGPPPIQVVAAPGDIGSREFEQAIHQLAEAVHRAVAVEGATRKWLYAVLDVRYNRQGSTWLSKIRATAPGSATFSVAMCNEIDLVLISLNAQRGVVFPDQWYGLTLTVSRERQCIELNYDPNCHENSTFFDS